MTKFRLRMPNIQDWETIWNSTAGFEKELLHWNSFTTKNGDTVFPEFHLVDLDLSNTSFHAIGGGKPCDGHYSTIDNQNQQIAFRPVLEASEELSCLADGTVIHFGSFNLNDTNIPIPEADEKCFTYHSRDDISAPTLDLTIPEGEEKEKISWIKYGNILMADRPLFSGLSYDALNALHMVEGQEIDIPFDRIATEYFYDMAMKQPASSQRITADIMFDITQDLLFNRVDVSLNKDTLYKTALAIKNLWSRDLELDLDHTISSLGTILKHGLIDVGYTDKNNCRVFESFPPDTIVSVLTDCSPKTTQLILLESMNANREHTLIDKNGDLTPWGKTISLLKKHQLPEPWILTDDDCLQYRRILDPLYSNDSFELCQIVELPDGDYGFCHGTISDISKIPEEEIEDYLQLYGYQNMANFVMETSGSHAFVYGPDGKIDRENSPGWSIDYGLIAEMIFETDYIEFLDETGIKSWDEAADKVSDFTGNKSVSSTKKPEFSALEDILTDTGIPQETKKSEITIER